MKKPIVTSIDVAHRAKVSQSAVSRTFTPGASVSDVTRDKVLEAANELGYRPNALARAMISGKSQLVALLVAYLDNQFYPIVIEKLSRALQERGYHVLLFMTDPGRQDEVVQQILQYQVRGIMMASATLSSKLAQECADTGIPVVMLNRTVPSASASSITSDNIEGGRLAASHLFDIGCTRIGYIAGNEDSSTNRDREAGFNRGLSERSLVAWGRTVGGYTFEGAKDAAREMMAAGDGPDGIFVANDHMAFAVMDVIRDEFKLRVPEDVAVVGYDDVPEASWGGYDLTSVSQSPAVMIAEAVAILLDQTENKAASNRAVTIPAELIPRGSTRRI